MNNFFTKTIILLRLIIQESGDLPCVISGFLNFGFRRDFAALLRPLPKRIFN